MDTNGFDDKLLKHFLNPQNIGVIINNDAYARVQNPVNGYTTDLYLKIQDNNITDVRFKTYGCTVTIAAGSAMTLILKNLNLDEFLTGSEPISYLEKQLMKEIGEVPEKNWHCVPTIIKAVLLALESYFQRSKHKKYVPQIEKWIQQINNEVEKKLHG
jgi:nitrogen fixation NifU-like protein